MIGQLRQRSLLWPSNHVWHSLHMQSWCCVWFPKQPEVFWQHQWVWKHCQLCPTRWSQLPQWYSQCEGGREGGGWKKKGERWREKLLFIFFILQQVTFIATDQFNVAADRIVNDIQSMYMMFLTRDLVSFPDPRKPYRGLGMRLLVIL